MLRRHRTVFSDKPGETEIAQHRIATTTEDSVVVHTYRLYPAWKDQVREELEQLLQAGIIRESTSPWASPIVPVRNSDGKIRLCIDFRRLNAVTKPDPFTCPLVDQIIDELGGRSFFQSSTSPKDSTRYWYMQKMLRRRHVMPNSKFEFLRMPFGLRNAPATFQRSMQKVLVRQEKHSSPYIDDVVIISLNWEDHMAHINLVLKALGRHGLTVKLGKCVWAAEYLDFVVGKGRFSVPKSRVKAVEEFQQPQTITQLRSFLGTLGYYRRFIQDFATHSKCLTAATRKGQLRKIQWMKKMNDSFHYLKLSLSSYVSLTIPMCPDTFVLVMDACLSDIAGVLCVCRNGEELPVSFYSRQLQDRETRYSATKLECLAVVDSVKQFEVYLHGRSFTVHTALVNLMSSTHLNKRVGIIPTRLLCSV